MLMGNRVERGGLMRCGEGKKQCNNVNRGMRRVAASTASLPARPEQETWSFLRARSPTKAPGSPSTRPIPQLTRDAALHDLHRQSASLLHSSQRDQTDGRVHPTISCLAVNVMGTWRSSGNRHVQQTFLHALPQLLAANYIRRA